MRHGKGPICRRAARSVLVALLSSTALWSTAFADQAPVLPIGGSIVSGSASIAQDGYALTVTQHGAAMVATWDSFSIGSGGLVRFDQPGASSVAVNRVTGPAASAIHGTIEANGRVFLINPSGILFGPGAQVRTGGGFVASTLDVLEADHGSGRYAFGGEGGSILNEGLIEGPVLALIAPVVRNRGTMRGSTALAGGTDVVLDFVGDGLLSVEVRGSTMATLVENAGVIEAPGGVVAMTARGASAAKAGVVNNTGRIEARGMTSRNGRIVLTADMDGGKVRAGGSLRAKSVETSAAKVEAAPGLMVQTDGGLWTIDPTDLTVSATMASALAASLRTGDALVETSGTGTGRGDIIVNAPIDWTDNTLTLKAHASVIVNAPLSVDGSGGLVIDYNSRGWPFEVANWDRGQITVNAPLTLGPDTRLTTITGPGDLGPFGPPRDTRTFRVLTTRADMAAVAADPGGSFVLGNDIDLSGSGPLVPAETPFTGMFEGFGHALTGIRIEQPETRDVGLFPRLSEATVRNLTLVGAVVSGEMQVGALAGTAAASVLHNLRVTSTVSSAFTDRFDRDGDRHTGGVVGQAGTTVLSNILADVNVSGTFDVGGITGSDGAIVRSEVRGNVTGSSNVGGLTGRGSFISDSASYVHVRAVTRRGNIGLSNPNFIGGGAGAAGVGPTMMNVLVAGTVTVEPIPGTGGNGFEFHAAITPGVVLVPITGEDAETFSFYLDSGLPPRVTERSQRFPGTEITQAAAREIETYTAAGWDFVRTWGISPDLNDGLPVVRALYPGFRFEDDSVVLVTVPSLSRVYGDPNHLLDGLWRVDGCEDCVSLVDWGPLIVPRTDAGEHAYNAPGVLNVVFSPDVSPDDYTLTFAPGSLEITRRVLTVSGLVISDKTYDGTTAVTALDAEGTLHGVLFDDPVFLKPLIDHENSFFASRNAGTDIPVSLAVTIEGVGGKLQNYTLDQFSVDSTANIRRRPAALLDVEVAQSREYDGTPFVDLTNTGQLFGIIPADQALIEVSTVLARTADKAAGTGKPVIVSAIFFGGAALDNYDMNFETNLTTNITPRAIPVTGSFTAEKEYDGTVALNEITGHSLMPDPSRLVSGDDLSVTISTATGRFEDRIAGENKQVFLTSGPVLAGADAGNYMITGDLPAGTGRITPKPLDLFGALIADKTYDGTLNADVASAGALGGVVDGDEVSHRLISGVTVFGIEPPRFGDRHAETDKLLLIGVELTGADAGNYRAPPNQTAVATIHPKPLILAGLDFGAGREYDGTTTVTPVFAGELVGIEGPDIVDGPPRLDALTGTLADKSAGENRPMTVSGTLVGPTAGNYLLDLPDGLTISVAPREIALAGSFAAEKEYDGTVAASAVSLASLMLDPSRVVPGDAVTLNLAGLGARFDDKNAGDGKQVFLDTLPDLGGADAGNYVLSSALPVGIGRITPKPLGFSGLAIADKTYDGRNTVTVTDFGRLDGVVDGDDVGHRLLSGFDLDESPVRFADRNAGEDKSVPVRFTLDGADAGNYLRPSPFTMLASIAPAAVSLMPELPALIRTYDGTRLMPVTGATFPDITQLVLAIDEVSLNTSAAIGLFDDKTVGTDKPISLVNVVLAGPDAGNYLLVLPEYRGMIEPAPLVLSGTTVGDKLFDGRTDATVLSPGSLSGVVAGDDVVPTGAVAQFLDPDPGVGKPVEVILVSLGGADAGNYFISPETLPDTTATIFSLFERVPGGPLSPGQPGGSLVPFPGAVGPVGGPGSSPDDPLVVIDRTTFRPGTPLPGPGAGASPVFETEPDDFGDGDIIFGGERSAGIEVLPAGQRRNPTAGPASDGGGDPARTEDTTPPSSPLAPASETEDNAAAAGPVIGETPQPAQDLSELIVGDNKDEPATPPAAATAPSDGGVESEFEAKQRRLTEALENARRELDEIQERIAANLFNAFVTGRPTEAMRDLEDLHIREDRLLDDIALLNEDLENLQTQANNAAGRMPAPEAGSITEGGDDGELGDGDAPISEPSRESRPAGMAGPVASAPQEPVESPPAISASEARAQAIEDTIADLARRNADLDESLETSRANAASLKETRTDLTFERLDLLKRLEANPDDEDLKNRLARIGARTAAVDREIDRVADLISPVLRAIAANTVLILWNEDQLRRLDTGQEAQTVMVEESVTETSDLQVDSMTEAERRAATEDARNRLEAAEARENPIRERLDVLGRAIERAAIAFAEAQRTERQLSNALEGSAPVGVNLAQVERLLVFARERMDSALQVIRIAMQEQEALESELAERTAARDEAHRDLAALGELPRSAFVDENLPDGLDQPIDMSSGFIDILGTSPQILGTSPQAPDSGANSEAAANASLPSQVPVELDASTPGGGNDTTTASESPTAAPQGPEALSGTPSTAELFAAGGLSVVDLRRFLDAVYEHMVLKQARLEDARAENARLRAERDAAEAAGDNARAEALEARIVGSSAFIAGETAEIPLLQGFLAGNLPFSALPQGPSGTAEQLVLQRAVDTGFLRDLYSGSGGPALADRPDLATLAMGPSPGASLAEHGIDPEKLTRFVSAFSWFLTQSREYLAIAHKRLEIIEGSGGSEDARSAEEARIRELEADVDLAERFLNGEAALGELDQARLNRVFTSVPVVFAWAGFGDTLRRFDPNSPFHQRGLAALAPPPPESASVTPPFALLHPSVLQDQRIPRTQASESFDLLQLMLAEGSNLAFDVYASARDVLAPEVRNVIDDAYARTGSPPAPLSRGALLVLRAQMLGLEDIVFPDSLPSLVNISE